MTTIKTRTSKQNKKTVAELGAIINKLKLKGLSDEDAKNLEDELERKHDELRWG